MLSIKTPIHPDRKEDLLDLMLEFFYQLQDMPITHPCTACTNYNSDGLCTRWNARPPEHIVKEEGCPEWRHTRRMPF